MAALLMMPMMKLLLFLSMLPAAACAALVERTVAYEQGDATLEGFHVYDDARNGKRPAVLIIHQWTGLTDYEKLRARMLAGMGYNVFAADIYGKGIRPQPPAAGKEAGKYKGDRDLYRARLAAGLEVLRNDERTDPRRIAAIGYCFGGTGVLELARSGAGIAGVVSFHGGLGAGDGHAATKGGVPARILVLHGADDPYVPFSEVEGFWKEMQAAGADWQIITYPNAVHAFTQKMAGDDPSKGAAYDATADRRSWRHMQAFFAAIFGE
ncbi:MAG: dienelactone hydrolase family protein [Akkermansiaceae bacterium]|nr:dienelactone hydrolase family protein [Akkermansiaceae bacterium]NNM30573.1 dienelactone hydrolase family protein [Akkermansiaceae bacterium]